MRSTVSGRSISIICHSQTKIRNSHRRAKFLVCGAAATAAMAFSPAIVSAQTNNYFGTSGNIGGTTWSTTSGGSPPGTYNQSFGATGGGIMNFENTTTAVTGASITVSAINVAAGVQVTGWTGGGTLSNFNNGIVAISVGAGGFINFNNQSFQSAATGGYIKNGAGTVQLSGNTYGGGFTLNEGVAVSGGVNSFGVAGGMTINGGTLAATSTRDFAGKVLGGYVINGDFQLGNGAFTSGMSLYGPISLGATGRTITIGGTGTYNLVGSGATVVSGTGGLSLTSIAGGSGVLSLTGNASNTFTGGMTVNGGTLTLAKSVSASALVTDLVMNGGTVNISGTGNQIADANRVTINGGTLVLGVNSDTVAGVTFNGGTATHTTVTTGTLTSNTDFDVRASAVITANLAGNVGLVKTTAGSATLAGGNLYTGGTTILGGTLQINNAGAITSTGGPIALSGGRLTIAYKDADLSKIAAGGGVGAGGTLRLTQTQTLGTSPGVISGTVEVMLTNINPNYTLDFATGSRFTNPAGSTGYGSAINLSGDATFEAQNTTFTLSGPLGTTGGGTKSLTLSGAQNGLLSGLITQGTSTLGIVKTGVGQWDVTNTTGSGNSITGPIAINEGTLRFTGNGTTVSSGTGVISINNTTVNDAVLSTTAGTITNAITVDNTGGGTGRAVIQSLITGGIGFSGNLTLNKALYIGTNNNSVTMSGTITGSQGIIVNSAGSGQVVLTAANTGWAGGITVQAGTLATNAAPSPDAFGAGAIRLMNGTTIAYAANGSYGFSNQGKITLDAGASATLNWSASTNRNQKINDIDLGAGSTLNVGIALGSGNGMNVQTGVVRMLGATTFNINQAINNVSGRFNIAGGLTDGVGSNDLVKTGNGLMVLAGNTAATTGNTPPQVDLPAVDGVAASYGGNTHILFGTLEIGEDNAVPVGTTVYVGGGGTFALGESNVSTLRANYNQSIKGLNNAANGAGQVVGNGVNKATNDATSSNIGARTLALTGEGVYSFGGAIMNKPGTFTVATNTLTLSKTGSGTQALTGANSYTGGTILAGGVLEIGPSAAASVANLTPGGLTITSGNTTANNATITVSGAQTSGVAVGMTVSGSGISLNTTVASVSGSTVVLSTVAASTQTAPILTFGNLAQATVASTAGLAPGQFLSVAGYGANTYITGIDGTTLYLSNNNTNATTAAVSANFNGWSSLPTTGSVSLVGGTFKWGAGNSEDYSARFATAAGQQYKLDTGGNNVTISTALNSTGGSLSKLGAGVLTLNANNTYSGPTTVAAGTLRLGASERLADASDLVFAGGKVDTGGNVETLDQFSLADNSELDFGTGTSALAFTGGVGSIDVTKSLLIANWSGDALNGSGTDQFYVGEDNSLTTEQLAVFTFVNPAGFDAGNYGATQLGSGEVVPYLVDVPEPSMLGLLSLGGLGLMRRRRRQHA